MPSSHPFNCRAAGIVLRDALLGSLVGVLAGLAAALFLVLLDLATDTRSELRWLVFLLPVAGFAMGWCIERWGGLAVGGTDLVIDHIAPLPSDDPRPTTHIPLRLAPLVLVGTVLTHLFGGSAGREGTAVQMGASLGDNLARLGRAAPALRRTLTVAGVAGGFGAVFGTPIAGCIFALEFATIGRLHHQALIPALFAAIVGDRVAMATGIVHTPFPTLAPTPLDAALFGKWLAFALIIASATFVFIELTDAIRHASRRRLRRLPLRMAVGGLAVVVLWQVVGADTWLGLGVPSIVAAYSGDALTFSFALKIAFTALTIGFGFLGGEVTPLFFIGATLGAVLAPVLDIPVALAAGVGMAAAFGAASNAPLALSIMAVELLGSATLPHVALVAVVAWVATGHRGIYAAQRMLLTKTGTTLRDPVPLRLLKGRRRPTVADADAASGDGADRPR